MQPLYAGDLAWIQAQAFGGQARGAAPHIIRLLRESRRVARSVVEVGCGAGPLTAALLEAGFSVTAIEPSPALLELARAAASGAGFIQASVYEVPLPSCEAVVALGEPLTYHDDPAAAPGKLRAFLQGAANALPDGGLLMFDLIETGQPSLTALFRSAGDGWEIRAKTREDAASSLLVREIEFSRRSGAGWRRGREVHCVRIFDSAEVTAWLADAGFAVETARGYGDQPLPPRRRAFFATRRP